MSPVLLHLRLLCSYTIWDFFIFHFWLPLRNSVKPKSALDNSYRYLHHFYYFCSVFDSTWKHEHITWSHFVSINRKSFLNFPAAIASRTPHASKPLKCHFLNLDLLFIPFALTVGHDRVSNSGFGVISKLFFFCIFWATALVTAFFAPSPKRVSRMGALFQSLISRFLLTGKDIATGQCT